MLRVTHTPDEIIIREIPAANWFRYLFSATVFTLPIIIAIDSSGYFPESFRYLGLATGAGIFLLLTMLSPVVTTKINKPGKTVSVRKQSLFRYDFAVYSFSEIAGEIYVEASAGKRDGTVYQLVLPLENGGKVELSAVDGSKRSQYFDAAHLMNPYVFDSSKQIPFRLTVFHDD